jgi:hypothetical protein
LIERDGAVSFFLDRNVELVMVVTHKCDGGHEPLTISTVKSGHVDIDISLLEALEGIRCQSQVL